jgi:hypothetical protein
VYPIRRTENYKQGVILSKSGREYRVRRCWLEGNPLCSDIATDGMIPCANGVSSPNTYDTRRYSHWLSSAQSRQLPPNGVTKKEKRVTHSNQDHLSNRSSRLRCYRQAGLSVGYSECDPQCSTTWYCLRSHPGAAGHVPIPSGTLARTDRSMGCIRRSDLPQY